MKAGAFIAYVGCCALAARLATAQQTSADVLTILRASLSAQAGQTVVRDISMSGNAESIAGSDDETASFSFKGTLAGSTRTDINLSAGMLTEIRTMSASGASGSWSKGSGKQHVISGHNLMTDPAWCSPLLIVERLLSSSAVTVQYIGTEGGNAHFRATQASPIGTPSSSISLIEHLGQFDFFLDPKSFLITRLTFNIHPDSNALVDLPVEVDFSKYETVSGVSVPMHLQRFVNNTLTTDIQLTSVLVNTGIPTSAF